jgi:hypothetical protein
MDPAHPAQIPVPAAMTRAATARLRLRRFVGRWRRGGRSRATLEQGQLRGIRRAVQMMTLAQQVLDLTFELLVPLVQSNRDVFQGVDVVGQARLRHAPPVSCRMARS